MNLLLAALPVALAAGAPLTADLTKPTDLEKIEITFTAQEQTKNYDYEENEETPKKPREEKETKRRANIKTSDADGKYFEMKTKLDEEFDMMFKLKEKLDKVQGTLSSKWEEYYEMQREYNKRLKKLIAAWALENQYE